MDRIEDFDVNSERWLSLEDFDGEVWKDIVGYEGFYQVSNYGRIKILERELSYINRYGKETKTIKHAQIMSVHDNGHGYLWVCLVKEKVCKHFYVHRLVAAAFIPNTNNLLQINHKDESKGNNVVYLNSDGLADMEKSNLEWCTAKYNSNYGTHRKKLALSWRSSGNCRSIDMYDLQGNLLKSYESASDMWKDGFKRRAVYNVANHRAKSYKGYVFRFKGDPFSFSRSKNKSKVKVYKYDSNNRLIASYNSIIEAELANGLNRNRIYSASYAKTRTPIINGYKYTFGLL